MAKTAQKALSTQKMGQAKNVGVNTKVPAQEKDLNQHELNQATIAGLSASKKKALATEKELNTNQKHTDVNAEKSSHTDAQADADIAVLADVDQNYSEMQNELAKFDASWNQTKTSSVMGDVAAAPQTNFNPWLIGGAAAVGIAAIAIANNGDDNDNAPGLDWEHQAFNYMDGLNIAAAAIKTDIGSSAFSAVTAYIDITDGLTRAQALNYVNNMNTVQGGDYTVVNSTSATDTGDFDITAKGGIINMVGSLENVYATISASSTTSDVTLY